MFLTGAGVLDHDQDVSLTTFGMACICPEEAMFKIWCKSVEFKGIKNTLKDG